MSRRRESSREGSPRAVSAVRLIDQTLPPPGPDVVPRVLMSDLPKQAERGSVSMAPTLRGEKLLQRKEQKNLVRESDV